MNDTTHSLSPQQLTRLGVLVQQRTPKRKASVSVSRALLEATDEIAGEAQRSAFIERALRRYLRHLLRQQRNARDRVILDANAERLNAEAAESAAYQAPLDDDASEPR
jgi:hypothetical protein